jgi:uncharacterized membrane protein YgcG
VSLTLIGGGVVALEGMAAAHEGMAGHSDLVRGTVTSVGTGSFTITTRKGTSKTIATTPTTTFFEPGTPVAPLGVAMGENVVVSLDPTQTTPTAKNVVVLLSRESGRVSSVSGTTITLSGPWKGMTRQVMTSSGTKYFNGKTAVSGVTADEFVTAFGTRDATDPSELNALFVDIANLPVVPPPGPPMRPPGPRFTPPGPPFPHPGLPFTPRGPLFTPGKDWNVNDQNGPGSLGAGPDAHGSPGAMPTPPTPAFQPGAGGGTSGVGPGGNDPSDGGGQFGHGGESDGFGGPGSPGGGGPGGQGGRG